MWSIIYTAYAVIGLIILPLLVLKPRFIKPVIIAILVGSAGLVIHGKLLVDKYLMAVVVLAIICAVLIGKLRITKEPQKRIDRVHQWIFFLMLLYFIFQILRGALVYSEVRTLLWIIYFVMLGIISFFLTHNNLPKLSREKISLIIVLSALLYLITYLMTGYFITGYVVKETGVVRPRLEGFQGVYWPQTVNATFMLVIVLPAAILLLRSKRHWPKILSIVLFMVSSITASFYQVKSAWLAIFSSLIVAPTIFSFRKAILLFFIFLILITLLGTLNKDFFNQIINFPRDVIMADKVRLAHLIIPFQAIKESSVYALFGYGFDSHRTVLIPYMEEKSNNIVSVGYTSSFSALLVDTGLMGLFLLFLNFIFIARKIILKKNNPVKIMLLASLVLTGLWLPMTEVLGVMLFYFIIMPGGLLIQLNES